MKLGEALESYRANRAELVSQRRTLLKQKEQLEKKSQTSSGSDGAFSEEAATLELSIKETNEKFEQNQEVLDKLTEQHCAVWNAEVVRQQSDVMKEYAVDMVKIMEVARRIEKGGQVPAADEKKLMDYSMDLYLAAKNMASLVQSEKREKYKSLWEEEDGEKEQYDPEGKADNATVGFELPDIDVAPAGAESAAAESLDAEGAGAGGESAGAGGCPL